MFIIYIFPEKKIFRMKDMREDFAQAKSPKRQAFDRHNRRCNFQAKGSYPDETLKKCFDREENASFSSLFLF